MENGTSRSSVAPAPWYTPRMPLRRTLPATVENGFRCDGSVILLCSCMRILSISIGLVIITWLQKKLMNVDLAESSESSSNCLVMDLNGTIGVAQEESTKVIDRKLEGLLRNNANELNRKSTIQRSKTTTCKDCAKTVKDSFVLLWLENEQTYCSCLVNDIKQMNFFLPLCPSAPASCTDQLGK